ncbi:shikimate kinase [Bacillus kwashiorkori]|uniref:shikimate kinase n=1 Tax=Bacillus kwashiorkori TaxID=1522318 RepID=UPI000784BAE3|nr:shikimate kinase [Bacillus kwashiorkori]
MQTTIIYLIGFMGAGKTTIGKELAKQLNWKFYDTDVVLQKKYHFSIPDIFSQFGENRFRIMENEVLKELSNYRAVIATGGGIVEDQENLILMKERGLVIYLSHPFQASYERIKNDKSRPLLKKTTTELNNIYNKRLPYYQQANMTIETNGKSPLQIVSEILSLLKK